MDLSQTGMYEERANQQWRNPTKLISIGRPFGQRESLINRIRKILKEYSAKASIFQGKLKNKLIVLLQHHKCVFILVENSR